MEHGDVLVLQHSLLAEQEVFIISLLGCKLIAIMLQFSTDDHIRIIHTDRSTFHGVTKCWLSELLRAVFAVTLQCRSNLSFLSYYVVENTQFQISKKDLSF